MLPSPVFIAKNGGSCQDEGCAPICFSQPAMKSKTSLLTLVLLHTTMNTGGVIPRACASVLFSEPVIPFVMAIEAVQSAFSAAGSFGSPPSSSVLAAFGRKVFPDS